MPARHAQLTLACLVALPAAISALTYPLNLAAAAALLELRLPSPRASVKAAYRQKATLVHPDVGSSNASPEAFVQITAAYEMMLQFGTSPTAPPPSSAPSSPAQSSWTYQRPPQQPRRQQQHQQRHQKPPPAGRDPERVSRRVQAWRRYWQLSFASAQAATEAEVKGAVRDAAEREVSTRRNELHAAQARGATAAIIDSVRAQYVLATARLADAKCAADTFAARARELHSQALETQEQAQSVA